MKRPELQVEIRFVATEEGGRRAPLDLANGHYRPIAILGIHRGPVSPATSEAEAVARGIFGVSVHSGPSLVEPGSTVTASLFVTMYEPGYERLISAGEFTLLEGSRVVGHGRVLGVAGAV